MKNLFISPTSTIKEALKKFNEIGEKVLIVVDENNHLLGTITDGDIRRYILNTGTIEETVENAYNKNPKFIYSNDSKEKAKQIMLENKIEILPVIDNQKRVIDFIVWTDLFENKFEYYQSIEKIDVPVVIMAGGKGTRLDPFTKVLPKPLIPIGDKTILELIFDKFKRYNIDEIYISLNYKSKILKSYLEELELGFKINFLFEDKPLGTIGSIKQLENIIKKEFILTNCDIIIDADYVDLLNYHRENKNDFTVVASLKNFKIPYGVCEIENGGMLVAIKEKPEYNLLINTGMYVLNPEILKYIPENVFFNTTDLIEELTEEQRKIGVYPIYENSWIDVGEWIEYKKAVERFNL
jgi:dTDP-glucose pyrophosphorylase